MSHARDKKHDCKMVDLNKPYSLRDWRVDKKYIVRILWRDHLIFI